MFKLIPVILLLVASVAIASLIEGYDDLVLYEGQTVLEKDKALDIMSEYNDAYIGDFKILESYDNGTVLLEYEFRTKDKLDYLDKDDDKIYHIGLKSILVAFIGATIVGILVIMTSRSRETRKVDEPT